MRDLGSKFNFSVSWDSAAKTISLDTTKEYLQDQIAPISGATGTAATTGTKAAVSDAEA